MEPVEVTKTMDNNTPDLIYRNSEDSLKVLTLECHNIKTDSNQMSEHESSIKMESLVSNNGPSLHRVSPTDPASVGSASAVASGNPSVSTSGNWTPLTPPQSTLQ